MKIIMILKTLLLVIVTLPLFSVQVFGQETLKQYLSGTGSNDTIEWEFYLTEGRNSGEWTTIPVPSQWELEGFGQYDYGHVPLEEKGHEKGIYRHTFFVPNDWNGNSVRIFFDGSMTDTEVRINGELAGPIHQGAFYRFSYNISRLLEYGTDNQLEVTVSKMSTNYSINMAERQADYWVFGGIFRPVYLEIKPPENIDRIAIDAGADGSLIIETHTTDISGIRRLQGQVKTLTGIDVGNPFSMELNPQQDRHILETTLSEPQLWSPEWPNLYQVEVSLIDDTEETIHTIVERFGFRTIELKPNDGFYLNGERIMFRGINRHTFWPESGRTTSKDLSIKDVNLIKEMNMNAVRMSHYPPDKHFLEVTDSLGLFVINELAGWQHPPYDTDVGKILVKSMVTRDVNHPSVVIWANGNEGGHNPVLDDDFFLYDIQDRPVIHPIQIHRDVDNYHYRPIGYGTSTFYNGYDVFLPTEFLHGLYDGGQGAGLDDHWNLMLSNPLSAGMFLWDFSDQGIVRTDRNNELDTDGNHGADGILGPYREKEASFYTVKEIWSPVRFTDIKFLPSTFNGKFWVENHYKFTNLNQIRFEWQLVDFPGPGDATTDPVIHQQREIISPSVEPGLSGYLDLALPENWANHDALYLTATDPHDRELFTWSWPVATTENVSKKTVSAGQLYESSGKESDQYITIQNDNLSVRFNKSTGLIEEIQKDQSLVSFSNGPVLNDEHFPLQSIELVEENGEQIVNIIWEEGRQRYFHVIWTLQKNGWLKFDYTFALRGEHDYVGISFDYPEEKIKGMTWMGSGPFRVWRNRLKGQQFGVWQKDFNNTITGEAWDYPEFKGYHSKMYWAEIDTDEQPVTMVFNDPGLYLHMLTPDRAEDAVNFNTDPPFPDGDISIMHGISPIGTKFRRADEHGLQGQKNILYRPKSGTVYFKFGSNNE